MKRCQERKKLSNRERERGSLEVRDRDNEIERERNVECKRGRMKQTEEKRESYFPVLPLSQKVF